MFERTACIPRIGVMCRSTVLLKEQGEREVRGSDFFGESSTLLRELSISTFSYFLLALRKETDA